MPAAPNRTASILPLGCEEIINVSQSCNTQKPSGQETDGGTNAFPRVHTRHGTEHARFVRAHVDLHKTHARTNNYIKALPTFPPARKAIPHAQRCSGLMGIRRKAESTSAFTHTPSF